MHRSRIAQTVALIATTGILALGSTTPVHATTRGGGPITIVKPPAQTWKPPSGINPNYYDAHGPMAGHKIQVENHLGNSAGWYPLSRIYEWNDNTDDWVNMLNLEVLPVGVKCQYHGWTCIKLFAVDDKQGELSWISHWGPWERDVTLNTYYYDHGLGNPDAKLDAGRQLCRRFANALGLGVGRGHDRDKGGSCMNTKQLPTGHWQITDLDHELVAGAYPLGKGGR